MKGKGLSLWERTWRSTKHRLPLLLFKKHQGTNLLSANNLIDPRSGSGFSVDMSFPCLRRGSSVCSTYIKNIIIAYSSFNVDNVFYFVFCVFSFVCFFVLLKYGTFSDCTDLHTSPCLCCRLVPAGHHPERQRFSQLGCQLPAQ